MKAFTNMELYQLYEEEDSAIFDILMTMSDTTIFEVIDYFGELDYNYYKDFIHYIIDKLITIRKYYES